MASGRSYPLASLDRFNAPNVGLDRGWWVAPPAHGRREGPDVVLLHGFLGSGLIFQPLTEHLSTRFTVTTIDLPGCGDSRDIHVPPTVEELTRVVADAVEASGIKRCAMLGHSLGAMVALELSLQRPDLLDRMVLYGGCPDGYLPDRFETTEQSVAKVRARGIAAVAANIAAEWFQRGRDDPMYRLALKAGANSDEEGAIVHLEAWDHWKARERLSEVSVATLIICGDNDRSTHPDLSIEMWKKIPDAQLFIAPGAGHAVHLELPTVFNEVVERFLE